MDPAFVETLKMAAQTDGSPGPAKRNKVSPAPAFGYADINKLEHCARLLQKNIRQIIEDAPSVNTLRQLLSDPELNEFSRQELQGNPLIQLLAKLKTLYETGELPLFDEIVGNRLEVAPRKPADKSALAELATSPSLSAPAGSLPTNGLTLVDHHFAQDLHLGGNRGGPGKRKRESGEEKNTLGAHSEQQSAGKRTEAHSKEITVDSASGLDSGNVTSGEGGDSSVSGAGGSGFFGAGASASADTAPLPPLPPIHDPALRNRVFQHKSTSANKTYLDEQEIVLAHNERLEFLGDAVLNTLVTFILYDRLPYASEGVLSQTRAQLVNNRTLAEFLAAYGFDTALRCTVDDAALRSSQKMYADVFEAYLGALAVERHLDMAEVERWLAELMHGRIEHAAVALLRLVPINKDAKTELYSLVGSAALHPTYKVVSNGDGVNVPYKVRCLMGEDVLGEGAAPGLRDAGLRAAMAALKNRPLLEKYGRQRWETDRCVSVVRGASKSDKDEQSVRSDSGGFPIVADNSVLPNKFAKNELYAYFGKQLGLTPEYVSTADPDKGRYRVELRVKDAVVAVAYDTSKKNAMSRAAAVVLEHKHRMNEILNYIG